MRGLSFEKAKNAQKFERHAFHKQHKVRILQKYEKRTGCISPVSKAKTAFPFFIMFWITIVLDGEYMGWLYQAFLSNKEKEIVKKSFDLDHGVFPV